jgi:CBS domain-containing protein
MIIQISDLLNRAPVTADPETSIRDAARIMTEARVSSLLVMDGERLAGMITDRDLRSRCIAEGRSLQEPVRSIMTERLHTTQADTLGFQALITMSRLNVHHLPVLDGGRVIGMLSTSDLVRFQSANAVYLVGDIHKAKDLDTLVAISSKVPELQVQLVMGGATSDHVGQAVSAVTDTITVRLLELAEARLGPPPVPYAWMAGGSQARREQSSHSDQDNALLIADHMKPTDDEYFAALAKIVNDGLDACGYYYCPGDVMASNPKWRQPLRIWRKYFTNWIERPEPMALMLASVFFDLRALHDPEGMFGELHEHILEHSRENRIFIAYMASNALKHRPPLGFFRNFVLISGGDHDHTLDLKHRGTVPIVDLARVYALSAGIPEINTIERLKAGPRLQAVSRDGAANLIDALEFIGTLRMRHQARQLRRGDKADNYLSPDELSRLERGHLKDAFSLINTMQESLGQRYQAGRFT